MRLEGSGGLEISRARADACSSFSSSASREHVTATARVVTQDYRAELPTPELIAEVRRLLFSERWAGRLICRYLADLAARIREGRDDELVEFIDEFHATARLFDLGARETRERVRIGRALRALPRIEAAFVVGTLCYSRVREVTRVASAETESKWLDLAQRLDMRAPELASRSDPGLHASDSSMQRGSLR